MKAAQIKEYGHADKVEVVEVDKPTPTAEQVLVEVQAASLNPFDTMVREGYVAGAIKSLPITLGGDIAGVVREVGSDVQGFAEGDIVYGQANVVAGNTGALAEYTATKAGQVAKAPANVDITEAASLPLIGVSALQALADELKIQSGQKLFIHGGGGGIGAMAIQIAKNLGAYVATTATGEDMTYATELGADEVIDYKTTDFSTSLSDFDAAFDTVGGDDTAKLRAILKEGGKALTMIGQAEGVANQQTRIDTQKLHALARLVETGVVKPRVGKVFELDQIQEAFEARENGSVHGKIVIHL